MSTTMPKKEEVLEIVRQNPSALQFKNSMKFIQTSTNMTLDRMINQLDLVLASIWLDGFGAGMESMFKENSSKNGDQVNESKTESKASTANIPATTFGQPKAS